MGHSWKGPAPKKPAVNADVSRPGSRNAWWVGIYEKHGETPHQTPFGCENCQRERLLAKGLVKP